MTHIIMSGFVKPLTEAERHFAKLKLRKIRAGEEEPPVIERPLLDRNGKGRPWDYDHEVVIGGRAFVSKVRAAELLGFAKTSIWTTSVRNCWETRLHPDNPMVSVFALADVVETRERKRKERAMNPNDYPDNGIYDESGTLIGTIGEPITNGK